ncbi:F-box domain-containing protein [Favolaschia claudopus]|uniref:F-box domain-containing protein n=1 Tax=Favolaschia claudopus TaxID=2862362 RepID=A0AAW0A1U3_9AGAR
MLDHMELDRAFVAVKDAQILELEAQISALQCSLSLLQEAKKPAKERLDSYKYPILTLPPEIVAEIFLRFLPTYPDPPPLVGPNSPAILTEICRQWREVALSLPALWSAIPLTSTAEAVASLAPVWLNRSACLPVSISATDTDKLFPVFSSLIPHCDRWEHLKLLLQKANNINALNVPMPLLHTLDIYLNDAPFVPVEVNSQVFPLLRTVIVDNFGYPGVALPWSQLTSLTLRGIFPQECISILQQALHLEHCALSLWGLRDGQNEFPSLILSRLESLILERESRISVGFFESLITPALRRLQTGEGFLGDTEDGFDPVQSLGRFITKSGCLLHELRVTGANDSQDVYREAFPSIPDIIVV